MDGGGVQHHQAAQLIACRVASGRFQPLGRLDAHGRGGIAQPQQVGADVSTEIPPEKAVFPAVRENAPQDGGEQLRQQPHGPVFLQKLPNPGPQAHRPGHRNRQRHPGLCPFHSRSGQSLPRPVSAAERMLRAISPVQIHPMTIELPPLAQDYAGEGQKEQCEKSAAGAFCSRLRLYFA